MAKARIPTDGSSSPAAASSSPFAALAAVRASLPDVPVVEATTTSTTTTTAPSRFGPKVIVRKEKKGHGGKTVTIVSGVLPRELDAICTALKTKLGCGARVEGDDVVVQGDLGDRVVAAVEALGAKKVVRGS